MKLYFRRNMNPRAAVAVARHLDAPVEYVHAAPSTRHSGRNFER
jgi:glutathione S-transferase